MSHIALSKIPAWRKIGSPATVLGWLEHGVELPFIHNTPPPPYTIANDIQASDQDFVTRKTSYWVLQGSAQEVVSADSLRVISPLLISKRYTGERRLFLNTHELNKYIESPHLKSGSMIGALREKLRPGDWMVKLDLKSGFSHIRLHENSLQYTGFEWQDRYYRYSVLPPGLSISAFCFNSLMQVVMNHLKSTFGGRVVRFTDDWLLLSNSQSQAETLSQEVTGLFDSLGLELGDRCNLLPSQRAVYVQSVVSTENGVDISLPAKRLEGLLDTVSTLKARATAGLVPAVQVAKVCGILRAAEEFGGPQGIRTLGSLYVDLRAKKSWNDGIELSSESLEDLAKIIGLLEVALSEASHV